MSNKAPYNAPLSNTILEEYNKLIETVNLTPTSNLSKKIINGTGGKISITDLIAYQIGWGKLLINWYETGINNKTIIMPGEGFTTWDYTAIAKYFYKKYTSKTFNELTKEFSNVVQQIITITEHEYDTNQLDIAGIWPWCTLKSGKQWPLSKWITVNTVAPYKRARTLIKKYAL